jgi:hypothetical protein
MARRQLKRLAPLLYAPLERPNGPVLAYFAANLSGKPLRTTN